MRTIYKTLIGMAVTGTAMAIVRRFSRNRAMQRKIELLQQKFRSLDNVETPNNS